MVLENRKHRGREAAIQRELEKEVGKRLGEAIEKALKDGQITFVFRNGTKTKVGA